MTKKANFFGHWTLFIGTLQFFRARPWNPEPIMPETRVALAPLELFMTEVRVFDWPETVRWYVETLRLQLLVNDEPNGFALLGAGHGQGHGHLALRRGVARCEAVYHVRLHFRVADVDAERSRLLAAGVSVTEALENDRESYREVRLHDPEGTAITLFTWTKPAP